MANIIYIGDSNLNSTAAHRAKSLERLGHVIIQKDPYEIFTSRRFEFIHFRTGYFFMQNRINQWAKDIIHTVQKPDLIWVDGGELLGPQCLKILKTFNIPIVLYNIDDPTGKRDGRKFDSLIKALPYYDQVVVVREETERECIKLGAKRVLRVLRSYDEVSHQPYIQVADIPARFKSEVVFIGTWMRHEKRDEFFLELMKYNIPIRIWGDRWQKSPYWNSLKFVYGGGSLSGRDYVAAMQGAKICLGLLSKGNRDLHTTRSLEIPYAGGLLCAERTTEHLEMYTEGVEAVFWADAKECAAVCSELLSNDARRESIRQAGMQRVRSNSVGNEDICQSILDEMNKLTELITS
ncbi:CgeB family protein [Arcticibacter eurypsychrophilus]|uniref:CgeB family protein n=1 Tax=Arcticibacter eurypsychrophilus TaxID=1434752 RepID=UPI00084DF79A|nr:glycosyltransferase [Arcticibacter eurypsychrophilus]